MKGLIAFRKNDHIRKTKRIYKLTRLTYNSKDYGPCDVCHKFCDEMWYQVEEERYGKGFFRIGKTSALFGHKKCLISARKHASKA